MINSQELLPGLNKACSTLGLNKACSTLGRFQHCCSRIAAARSQPHCRRPLAAPSPPPASPPPARSHIAAACSQPHGRRLPHRRHPLAAESLPPARSRIATARSQPHRYRLLAGSPPGAGLSLLSLYLPLSSFLLHLCFHSTAVYLPLTEPAAVSAWFWRWRSRPIWSVAPDTLQPATVWSPGRDGSGTISTDSGVRESG